MPITKRVEGSKISRMTTNSMVHKKGDDETFRNNSIVREGYVQFLNINTFSGW